MKIKLKSLPVGAMTLLASFLIISAVIRIGIGASAAFAREDGAEQALASSAVEDAPLERRIETDEDLEWLFNDILEREARVLEREAEVEARILEMQNAENIVREQLNELEKTEESLRALMALSQTAAEDDLTQLTDVYSSMKPKQAAALFEEMDPDFAAGFLSRMRPEVAAAIMAGLTPTAAYTISVILAGRNAEAPTQ